MPRQIRIDAEMHQGNEETRQRGNDATRQRGNKAARQRCREVKR